MRLKTSCGPCRTYISPTFPLHFSKLFRTHGQVSVGQTKKSPISLPVLGESELLWRVFFFGLFGFGLMATTHIQTHISIAKS